MRKVEATRRIDRSEMQYSVTQPETLLEMHHDLLMKQVGLEAAQHADRFARMADDGCDLKATLFIVSDQEVAVIQRMRQLVGGESETFETVGPDVYRLACQL